MNLDLIDELKRKVSLGEFELSRHATEQMADRQISLQEIHEAVRHGSVIEDNPNDKYWPSCLLFGQTTQGRMLHLLCSYPTRLLVKVITLYEPNPNEWLDGRTRRS